MIIKKKFINSSKLKNENLENNNPLFKDSKRISNEILSENEFDIEKNSSKNLADFFNGQIIDTEKE